MFVLQKQPKTVTIILQNTDETRLSFEIGY